MRDYQIVSPSLEGVLNHDSLLYDGIKRPLELLRILDGPATKGKSKGSSSQDVYKYTHEDRKLLEEYFHDLHSVFLKRLSYFIIESDNSSDDSIKLQAMLQEIVKIKGLMGK
ncbi:MAG: hypothetical protein WC666_02930 [Candidatus Paceibacterota bacterium]|jgi:hypothetical protein